jgi:hypothetical protein
MERDVELAELGLQNQATWKVLEFAERSREASTRLHGVAFGLLPFASAAVGASALLIYASLGAVFLAIVGISSFININGLRMLQYRLAVEEGKARVRLRNGTAVHDSETDAATPPALARQMDPMGGVTRGSRWLVAADLGVAGPLLAASFVYTHGSGRPALVAVLLVSALALSAALAGAWLTWSRLHSTGTEAKLAEELRRQQTAGA